jgi:hypothetical protein
MTHQHYRIWSSTKSTMWKIPAKTGYANDAFVGEGIPSIPRLGSFKCNGPFNSYANGRFVSLAEVA